MSLAALATVALCQSPSAATVEQLRARCHAGQVFLTWTEPSADHGGSYSVYIHDSPITEGNLGRARLLAGRVEAHSARDWWSDPATYFEEGEAEPVGWKIEEGADRLDPSGGLFVHTVTADDPAKAYYAVTLTVGGTEDRTLLPGKNSLERPAPGAAAPVEPIWLDEESRKPLPGTARGLPTVLSLHGRGSRRPVNWLAFGPRELGWREGLAFEFYTEIKDGYLLIGPMDRTWVGRTLTESWDRRDHFSPAIDTFWYGYNDMIYDRELMAEGTPANFTERRLLWILDWASKYFRTDSLRTVLIGGSMGGCGGLSFGLRHPEIFSAVVARVPLVGYFGETESGVDRPGSAATMAGEKRLTPFCGPLDRKDNEGTVLGDRMDSRSYVRSASRRGIDLPFLVISNSRNDGSIPWRPNPRYFRLLGECRQGFIAGWDDGTHATSMDGADPWFEERGRPESLFRFALNESFPAFSRCSTDNDPGDGDPDRGDIAGYMNLGLEWRELVDRPDRWEATVYVGAGAPEYPVAVDITPRRVQRFRLEPGGEARLRDIAHDGRMAIDTTGRADGNGRLTFERFLITGPEGNRVVISRDQPTSTPKRER